MTPSGAGRESRPLEICAWGRRPWCIQQRVGHLLAGLVSRRDEVRRRCRTVLQSKAEALLRDSRPDSQHSANAHPTLALVLICPQGKFLRQGSFHNPELAEGRTSQYVARQKDCQAYPVKEACLPPKQKRRYFTLTMYYPEYLRAKERNRTDATGRSLAVVRPSPMEPSLPWAD